MAARATRLAVRSGPPEHRGGRRTSPSGMEDEAVIAIWKLTAALAAAVIGVGGPVVAAAAGGRATTAHSPMAAGGHRLPAFESPVCGTPAGDHAACHLVQLLQPSRYWHPGPDGRGPGHGGGGGAVPAPPASGFYPADLQSAYGLASAAAAVTAGPTAPTIAIVDAYDDPRAASDLAAYRASLSAATDPATGLRDAAIPPVCSASGQSGCVAFTKVNQTGGTSYPKGNSGWAEEISLDLDMVSAICPACNIVLVEATSSSFANLAQAVTEAKAFHPAAITNSYGGGEFSSETSDTAVFSGSTGTAMTAATGDSGYGVEFPAASPGLTAVGGTTLTYTGTGAGLTWAAQTVWSGAGSGCSAYEALPGWQSDPGVYSQNSVCTGRQVGDVAAVANPQTGVAAYDTYGQSGWLVFGGTSVSTQIVGAIYGLAAGSGALRPSPSALYVDTGTGATGPTPGLVPVASGSTATCGDYLCDAQDSLPSGYNGPTGLGTPDGTTAFAGPAATAGSLTFSPPSVALTAGTTAGPISIGLSQAAPSTGLALTLSTTSPTGGFSASSSGTPTASMTLSVAGGASQSAPFYYTDQTAGSPTVRAAASGWSSGTLAVTVTPAALATLVVSPTSAAVAAGSSQGFTATGTDLYGNPVSVDPTWSTSVQGASVSPASGSSTTFAASASATGNGLVTATASGVTGSASVSITALAPMSAAISAGSVAKRGPQYKVPLTVSADSGSGTPISGASASIQVYAGTVCGGPVISSGSGTTGTSGQVAFTFSTRKAGSWCAAATVTDAGHTPATAQTTFSS